MSDDPTKMVYPLEKLVDLGITYIEASIEALPVPLTPELRGTIWQAVAARASVKIAECKREEPQE